MRKIKLEKVRGHKVVAVMLHKFNHIPSRGFNGSVNISESYDFRSQFLL